MEKFGKKSADILDLKKTFFQDNQLHLNRNEKIAKIYREQPNRTSCKLCASTLPEINDFSSHNVNYIICTNCTHLNGKNQDTSDFCSQAYASEEGNKDYGLNYSSENSEAFNKRVEQVYKPKAQFLLESIKEQGLNPFDLSYLDYGAGSGYFVSAMDQLEINIKGYEVSKSQVEMGNQLIKKNLLNLHALCESNNIIKQTKSEVISMIGVLEHLQNPRSILHEIKANKNIQYFFFSVPTFSLSVMLEILFKKSFNRQLGGGHTHLYTKKSLEYMVHEFGMGIASEWWFGTDMVDLLRHGMVNLELDNVSSGAIDIFNNSVGMNLDELQIILDKKKQSSEVHMLLKTNP